LENLVILKRIKPRQSDNPGPDYQLRFK